MKNQVTEMVIKFDELIEKKPDMSRSVSDFISFFRTSLRVNMNSRIKKDLPLVEMMTIVKHKKPNIYYELKKNYSHYQVIQMLVNVEMGLENAEKKLINFKEKL